MEKLVGGWHFWDSAVEFRGAASKMRGFFASLRMTSNYNYNSKHNSNGDSRSPSGMTSKKGKSNCNCKRPLRFLRLGAEGAT